MLSRAFFDDPLSVYFFPDEERRKAFQPQLMEYWLRHDVVYGEVYAISPKLEGIAAWVHSDKADRTLWRLLRNGAYFIKLDRETDEKRKIVHNLCAEMHNRHVTGPHWYLEFIGVEPALKGTGYASKLLRPMLERIDKEGLPCYLETQNPENIPLYEHFGFKVMEEGVIPGSHMKQFAVMRGKH
jgi:ribosomal protein S18 acetylase RimI-like enzyme